MLDCDSEQNSTTASVNLGTPIGQLTVGSLVILLNGILLLQMIFNRQFLRWKYHALTCHMVVCDLCSGFFFAILAMMEIFGREERFGIKWVSFELFLSSRLAIMNYNCSLYLQYIAIRDPFKFKTRINKLFLIKLLFVTWLVILPYVVLQSTFFIFYPNKFKTYWSALADGIIMSICMIMTVFHYYHVMKVARQKKSQEIVRRCTKWKSDRSNSTDTLAHTNPCSNSMKGWSLVRIYKSLIATGFSLFVFLLSYCPCLIMSFIMIFQKDEYFKNFCAKKSIIMATVIVVFTRAIFDPLIFLIREPKLKNSFSLKCDRSKK